MDDRTSTTAQHLTAWRLTPLHRVSHAKGSAEHPRAICGVWLINAQRTTPTVAPLCLNCSRTVLRWGKWVS